jgi:hypothetical protein
MSGAKVSCGFVFGRRKAGDTIYMTRTSRRRTVLPGLCSASQAKAVECRVNADALNKVAPLVKLVISVLIKLPQFIGVHKPIRLLQVPHLHNPARCGHFRHGNRENSCLGRKDRNPLQTSRRACLSNASVIEVMSLFGHSHVTSICFFSINYLITCTL